MNQVVDVVMENSAKICTLRLQDLCSGRKPVLWIQPYKNKYIPLA